jgi:receptor protein-tyrosine kinase
LTPEELLRVARRRILVVILCAVVVPASALGWSLGQDKEYTATSQLLFRDPGFDQRLFDSQVLQPSASPERQAATNVLLVSNRRVAERTARALGFGLTGAEIAARREVAAEGQADVISVSMTDSEPMRAAQLANTYASEFIEFRREADRAKITEALTLVDRQLDELSSSETETDDEEALRRQADQLEVLVALQTGNAELVQAAEPPDSPSSPQTVRNVVLGGVVGLLMGLGLALLLERLDRRLRDPEEIETAFGRPILGTVPESRALGRAGPPSPGVPGWIESESFSMIRANLRYFNVGRPTRSILVTSAAPGEGKTTITWNLAAAAAAAGDRVLLIEADLRHPSLLDTEGLGPKPGLGALLAGNADVSDVLIQLSVPNQGGDERVRQMDVVPAGAVPPNPIDLLESEVMEHLIRDAEERYELVIIDTAPTAVVSDAIPLVTKVSGVIVVTRLGKSTRTAMQQLRRQLENLDAPTLGVVVNSMKSEAAGYGYGYGYGSAPNAAANGALSAPPDEHQPEPIDAGKTR